MGGGLSTDRTDAGRIGMLLYGAQESKPFEDSDIMSTPRVPVQPVQQEASTVDEKVANNGGAAERVVIQPVQSQHPAPVDDFHSHDDDQPVRWEPPNSYGHSGTTERRQTAQHRTLPSHGTSPARLPVARDSFQAHESVEAPEATVQQPAMRDSGAVTLTYTCPVESPQPMFFAIEVRDRAKEAAIRAKLRASTGSTHGLLAPGGKGKSSKSARSVPDQWRRVHVDPPTPKMGAPRYSFKHTDLPLATVMEYRVRAFNE